MSKFPRSSRSQSRSGSPRGSARGGSYATGRGTRSNQDDTRYGRDGGTNRGSRGGDARYGRDTADTRYGRGAGDSRYSRDEGAERGGRTGRGSDARYGRDAGGRGERSGFNRGPDRGTSASSGRAQGSQRTRTSQRAGGTQRKEKAKYLAIPGRMPVLEALKANRNLYEIFIDKTMADSIDEIVQLAAKRRVVVTYANRERMDNMVDGVRHQGILATTAWPEAGSLSDHLHHQLVVVLDGVTDPRNLGAIARSAEQAGAGCLIVRNRRAAGYSPAAEKASAGALSWIPMVTVSNINQTLQELHEAGMWTIGLAGEADASTIWEEPLMRERVALVIGEEGEGLSFLVSQNCDARMSIPMRGHLDSLNASTAAAVALFEWVRLQHTT